MKNSLLTGTAGVHPSSCCSHEQYNEQTTLSAAATHSHADARLPLVPRRRGSAENKRIRSLIDDRLHQLQEQCACCSAGGLDLDELRFPRHWGSSALVLQGAFALVGICGGLQNYSQARRTKGQLHSYMKESQKNGTWLAMPSRSQPLTDAKQQHRLVYQQNIAQSAQLQQFYQWGSGMLPVLNGALNALHVGVHFWAESSLAQAVQRTADLSALTAQACLEPAEHHDHHLSIVSWLNPAALATTAIYAWAQAGRLAGWEYPRVACALRSQPQDPINVLLTSDQTMQDGLVLAETLQRQRQRFVLAGSVGFIAMGLGAGLWCYEALAQSFLLPVIPGLSGLAAGCFFAGMGTALLLNNWQLAKLAYNSDPSVLDRSSLLDRAQVLKLLAQTGQQLATTKQLAAQYQSMAPWWHQMQDNCLWLGQVGCAIFKPIPGTTTGQEWLRKRQQQLHRAYTDTLCRQALAQPSKAAEHLSAFLTAFPQNKPFFSSGSGQQVASSLESSCGEWLRVGNWPKHFWHGVNLPKSYPAQFSIWWAVNEALPKWLERRQAALLDHWQLLQQNIQQGVFAVQ